MEEGRADVFEVEVGIVVDVVEDDAFVEVDVSLLELLLLVLELELDDEPEPEPELELEVALDVCVVAFAFVAVPLANGAVEVEKTPVPHIQSAKLP